VPLQSWFRGDLGRVARSLLTGSDSQIHGYLRRPAVRTLLDEHLTGRRAHGQRLYALLCLELWLRTFIAGPPPGHSPPELTLKDLA
jgi:asparagine synthase (glutamine-hydrolysing)